MELCEVAYTGSPLKLNLCLTLRCTYITGTPTMFSDMLKAIDGVEIDFSNLKAVITGGAICSPELVNDIRNRMPLSKVVVSA